MRYLWICLLGCVALWMCPLSSSYALDVTLAWDANSESDLAGYVIYYDIDSGDPYYGEGASDGDSPIDVPLDLDEDPDPDVVQFTLYDLPEGTYFFAVTAYNEEGLESGYSNEVSTSPDEQSTPVDEDGTPAHMVSTSNAVGTTGGGGGGGCFIATASQAPNAPQHVPSFSLILFSLVLLFAVSRKKFRK